MVKRGQISLAVILALFVMISLGFVVYIGSMTKEARTEKATVKSTKTPLDTAPLQRYVDSCFNEAALKALRLVGESGGCISAVNTSFNEDEFLFGIMCDPSAVFYPAPSTSYSVRILMELRLGTTSSGVVVYMPNITNRDSSNNNSIVERLRRYVLLATNECLTNYKPIVDSGVALQYPPYLYDFGGDAWNLSKQNLSYTSERIKMDVIVSNYSVYFNMKYPIVLTKKNAKTELVEFTTEIAIPLRFLIERNLSYLVKNITKKSQSVPPQFYEITYDDCNAIQAWTITTLRNETRDNWMVEITKRFEGYGSYVFRFATKGAPVNGSCDCNACKTDLCDPYDDQNIITCELNTETGCMEKKPKEVCKEQCKQRICEDGQWKGCNDITCDFSTLDKCSLCDNNVCLKIADGSYAWVKRTDAQEYPGVTCDDGIDNDCDGFADGADPDCPITCSTDTQCADTNVCTADKCNFPGSTSSFCTQVAIPSCDCFDECAADECAGNNHIWECADTNFDGCKEKTYLQCKKCKSNACECIEGDTLLCKADCKQRICDGGKWGGCNHNIECDSSTVNKCGLCDNHICLINAASAFEMVKKNDAREYPGVTCGDGIDNDCDDLVDDADQDCQGTPECSVPADCLPQSCKIASCVSSDCVYTDDPACPLGCSGCAGVCVAGICLTQGDFSSDCSGLSPGPDWHGCEQNPSKKGICTFPLSGAASCWTGIPSNKAACFDRIAYRDGCACSGPYTAGKIMACDTNIQEGVFNVQGICGIWGTCYIGSVCKGNSNNLYDTTNSITMCGAEVARSDECDSDVKDGQYVPDGMVTLGLIAGTHYCAKIGTPVCSSYSGPLPTTEQNHNLVAGIVCIENGYCDSDGGTTFTPDGRIFNNDGTNVCCRYAGDVYAHSEANGNCCYHGTIVSSNSALLPSLVCWNGDWYGCGSVTTSPEANIPKNDNDVVGSWTCNSGTWSS